MKVRRTVRPGLDRRQWVVVIKIICKRHFFVVWPAAAQLDKIIFLVSEVKYFLMKYFCAGNTRCAGVYGVCKKWLMAWCGAGTRTQTFMSSQVFHRDSRVNKFQFYFSSTRCTYVDICQFPLNNYWDKVDFLSVDLDLQEKVARTGWGREQVGCYDWWWWGWWWWQWHDEAAALAYLLWRPYNLHRLWKYQSWIDLVVCTAWLHWSSSGYERLCFKV